MIEKLNTQISTYSGNMVLQLEMHQPVVIDAATLREYCQDFAVSKFLSGLSLTLRSQMMGKILGGDSIPTLTDTFSRVVRVFTGADVSSAPSIEQSAMYSGRGRGHSRGHEFGGGRGSFGVGHIFTSGRQSTPDKGPRHCKYCGRSNCIFERC